MRIATGAAPLAATRIRNAAPAAADVKKGVEKWRSGDYKAAVTEWLPFAARGDADASFNMGQAYKLGRGVTKNEATALDYYRKAAVKGHGPAQEKLGITLYATPATRAEGLRWLEQAARKNQPRAQYVLGVAYFNGDTVPKNWPLAYAYMLRANNAGVQQAMAALTTMNANIPLNDRAKGEEIANAMMTGTYTPQPVAMAQAAPRTVSATPAPTHSASAPAAALTLGVPSAVAAPAPVQPVAGARSWRVQLGAYSQRSMAAEIWADLKAEQGSIVGGAEPIYAENNNGMVRLQLGPFSSRDDASRMCTKLKAVGRNCFVVG